MRRAAYIKALEQAATLPKEILELLHFFGREYSPRLCAISAIKEFARKDDKLFTLELVDILNWKENDAKDNDNTKSNSEESNQERSECP